MTKAPREWTVLSMMEWATDYFKERNIPDPRLSIEWLLAQTLDVKRLDLYMKFDRPLSADELDQLRPLVKRRAQHEPLQYILGFTEFMNARIDVAPGVLIPRIETEQMVEIILDRYEDRDEFRVLDIGTGSGCIPIALKKERPGWNISAMDISSEALNLAHQNAEQNDVEINFFQADILDWEQLTVFDEPLDLIVSNPPYILPEEKETLEPQVREYEPELALFAADLIKIYSSIRDFASAHLTTGGRLYLELHELHADDISALFNETAWNKELRKDYNKKPRFLISEKG